LAGIVDRALGDSIGRHVKRLETDAIAAAQHWLTLIASSSGQQFRWKAIGRDARAR
jgi:hypothetical protein